MLSAPARRLRWDVLSSLRRQNVPTRLGFGQSPEVEGALDRAGVVLTGDRRPGVAPVVEAERVRQHRAHVDAPRADEVEVVLDRVLTNAFHLFDTERVRPDDARLLE